MSSKLSLINLVESNEFIELEKKSLQELSQLLQVDKSEKNSSMQLLEGIAFCEVLAKTVKEDFSVLLEEGMPSTIKQFYTYINTSDVEEEVVLEQTIRGLEFLYTFSKLLIKEKVRVSGNVFETLMLNEKESFDEGKFKLLAHSINTFFELIEEKEAVNKLDITGSGLFFSYTSPDNKDLSYWYKVLKLIESFKIGDFTKETLEGIKYRCDEYYDGLPMYKNVGTSEIKSLTAEYYFNKFENELLSDLATDVPSKEVEKVSNIISSDFRTRD